MGLLAGPGLASALGLLTLAVTVLGLATPVVASTIFFRVDQRDTTGRPIRLTRPST
jgi:hypothetical protein